MRHYLRSLAGTPMCPLSWTMTNVWNIPAPTAKVMERRRHPRTPLKMKLSGIRLDPDGGDVVDSLSMVDISRSGMGAICRRPFYPGQRIVLCLPISPEHGRRKIYATAVRCKECQDGYRVGFEFDSASLAGQFNADTPAVAAA